jgi:hypothetical protein
MAALCTTRVDMKFVLLLFIVIIPLKVLASPVSCEQSPEQAKIELPAPINKWALIFCSPAGHAVAPIDGDVWLAPNGKPFLFQSAGLMNPPKLESKHLSYFSGLSHRKLEGSAKNGTNMMLTKSGLPEDQAFQPWQLDIVSNKGIRYNLFFYEKDGKVKHVLGCVNQCQQSVLLVPKTLDKLKADLAK